MELVKFEKQTILDAFTGDKMDELLNRVKVSAENFVPDTSTAASRKQIASVAYMIPQCKGQIEDIGKALVSEEKAKIKLVDAARKKARDFLTVLKVETRKPLTDWETADEVRKGQEAYENKFIKDYASALEENDLFDRKKVVERGEAKLKEEQEKRDETDRIEQENKANEKRENEKVEQQRRRDLLWGIGLKWDGSQFAYKDINVHWTEIVIMTREAFDALYPKLKVRMDQIKIEEADEEDKKREAEMERVRMETIQKGKDDQAERDRIKDEAQTRKEKAALTKSTNEEHIGKIKNQAYLAFISYGIVSNAAGEIVELIEDGKIPNITINF